MKKTLALMTMMSAFAATPALAEDVPFSGTVSSTCTIDNINAGSLGVNGDASVLSSSMAGGTPGSADVTANSNLFNLTVTDPTGWSSGTAAPAGSTFVSSTTFNGSTFGAGANDSYTAIVQLTCS